MGGTSTDISLHRGRRAAARRPTAAVGGEQGRAAEPRHRAASAPAAARSRGSTRAASCTSGPRARAPSPGPPATASGGTAATVTDANLVLGYLDPGQLPRRARRASIRRRPSARSTRSRGTLGVDRIAAAEGIHRVVNTRHGRGHPPGLGAARRRSAALRAARLRRRGRACTSPTSRASSRSARDRAARRRGALGLGHARHRPALRGRAHRTSATLGAGRRGRACGASSARWRPRAGSGLARGFAGRSRVRPLGRHALRRADLRDQRAARRGRRGRAADLDATQVVERFHRRHEELYTYSAAGPGGRAGQRAGRRGRRAARRCPRSRRCRPARRPAPPRRRRIYLGDWLEVPVYDLDALAPGQAIDGPAIVESATTTVLLRAGERATVTAAGWLDIRLG